MNKNDEPTYNRSKLLIERSVPSVLNQTYKNWEITFVDDCSTDGSLEFFLKLVEKYHIENAYDFQNEENLGITKTKQLGFNESYGDFFMSLDVDDWISENYMKEMLSTLMKNPTKSFVYCDTIYHFPDGKEHRFYQPEYNVIRLIENNFMSYCSLYRSDDFAEIGYDLNNRGHHEDYQLSLKYAYSGKHAVHCHQPLFHYRIHQNQSMQSSEVQNNGNLFKAYFITQMPEMFPESWLEPAQQMLKSLPDNIMELRGKEFEEALKNKGEK